MSQSGAKLEVRRLFMGSMDGFLGAAMPFNGYAILHPDGVVLIDTSFGEVFGPGRSGVLEFGESRWPWMARSTLAALADHGVEPGDVKYVINTHLGDHSGENHLFKEATFVIQRPEFETVSAAAGTNPFSKPETFDFPGAKFELLDGEDAEVLSGVRVLFTPGHTVGHQSVLVNTGAEKQLFVGDAVYDTAIWADLDTMTQEHPAWDSQVAAGYDLWLDSARKLKSFEVDVVHFSHDEHVAQGTRG
jgi:N-acyl homoserine lactone hydrolase